MRRTKRYRTLSASIAASCDPHSPLHTHEHSRDGVVHTHEHTHVHSHEHEHQHSARAFPRRRSAPIRTRAYWRTRPARSFATSRKNWNRTITRTTLQAEGKTRTECPITARKPLRRQHCQLPTFRPSSVIEAYNRRRASRSWFKANLPINLWWEKGRSIDFSRTDDIRAAVRCG
jgi:hypothetical protein